MNQKVRDIGLVSIDRILVLTGHTDVSEIAKAMGIIEELEEVPYIPQYDSMILRNGSGYWYNIGYVEDGPFENFIFHDFLKGVKRYIPKNMRSPPIFLVNEKYHLTIALAPRVEVGV